MSDNNYFDDIQNVFKHILKKPVFYKLVGRKTIPCTREELFGCHKKNKFYCLGIDVINSARVSTVFTPIDMQIFGGEPLLFETMVFGGKYDQYQRRYHTYKQAEEGHKEVVSGVKNDTLNED